MEAAINGQLDVNTQPLAIPELPGPGEVEVEVRPSEYLAIAMGQPLNLTSRELELLTALVEREGRIVSREELHRTVWGDPYRKADRSVDVYVAKLRQKLDEVAPHRRFIHTHFGFGYRFHPEPARSHLSHLS